MLKHVWFDGKKYSVDTVRSTINGERPEVGNSTHIGVLKILNQIAALEREVKKKLTKYDALRADIKRADKKLYMLKTNLQSQ